MRMSCRWTSTKARTLPAALRRTNHCAVSPSALELPQRCCAAGGAAAATLCTCPSTPPAAARNMLSASRPPASPPPRHSAVFSPASSASSTARSTLTCPALLRHAHALADKTHLTALPTAPKVRSKEPPVRPPIALMSLHCPSISSRSDSSCAQLLRQCLCCTSPPQPTPPWREHCIALTESAKAQSLATTYSSQLSAPSGAVCIACESAISS